MQPRLRADRRRTVENGELLRACQALLVPVLLLTAPSTRAPAGRRSTPWSALPAARAETNMPATAAGGGRPGCRRDGADAETGDAAAAARGDLGQAAEEDGEGFEPAIHPNGTRLPGGPQMLQLSMDGRRLYVTNSLYSSWDNQFYPDLRGWMLTLDAGDDGLRVDPDFFVDFHPARAHEIHLPGGDPTTEIFS